MAGDRDAEFGVRLSAVLAADEVSSLDEIVKKKLEGVLDEKERSVDCLKSQLERERVNSEQRYCELEKRLVATSTQVETESGTVQELNRQKAQLEEKWKASVDKLEFIEQNREDNSAQTQQLTRVNKQLEAEKNDLLGVLHRKDREIKRLNEDWQSMAEKLSEANTTKNEIQVKYDEAQSQDVSVKYREKRLEQEKQMLTSQNEWLSSELENKTSELLSVRKEKSNQILELQGQLNSKTDETKHLQDTADALKKTHDEQNERIEKLVKKIQENHEAMAKSEEQFLSEIQAQSKLANLYKSSADEAEGKVKELITAVEELQKLLKQATGAQAGLDNKVQEMETSHSHKEQDLGEKISKLEKELEDANDLIEASRIKATSRMTDEEISELCPTAAAASSFLKSGMTLTQIYSEYVKASDDLQLEQQENQRLNRYMDQILQEIEEKAPVMLKQREDYERSLETNNSLSIRLDSVLLEYEQLRVTCDEGDRRLSHNVRENQRMKQQCADLGQQVRVLLNELQEIRGGPINQRNEADVSSSDISSSSHTISEHLVTFRSIEELQKQNEQLLTAIRDLSEQQEQKEKETVETETLELRRQLESALDDLEQMKTSRARQGEMVESIVRQRDMYRVLLQQSGTAPPMVPATPSPRQSPEKPKTPVAEPPQKSPGVAAQSAANISSLEDTKLAIQTLQTEYDTYKKEKSENARMLNEQIDKLQQELSDMRVLNAKLASQLDFSSERFKTAQSNVESYKTEIAGMRDKNQKVMTEVIQHQQTISSMTQDLAAAQERCSRAEVRCENLRAERDLLKNVETRLTQEKESLIREQRGQNLLLTNLQTIQNNLERSEFETKARLTNQLETMERELTVLRRRLEGDNDQHRTVLKSWEVKVQELHRQLNHELENHGRTREDLHKCKSDLQNMKQQCSGVEAQLVSAQIKLENAVREKNEAVKAGSKKTVVSSSGHEEELRELRVTIRKKDDEIRGLNGQVTKAKQHAEEYKSISVAIEESLREQKAASQTMQSSMENRLQETIQAREQLEKQVRDLEKELPEVKTKLAELVGSTESETSELRRTVSRLQDELKEAINQKSESEAMEMAARQDSQEQARVAKEAQDKFEREFLLHAADVQQLVTVKEQLSSHNAKLAECEKRAKTSEEALASSKTSWEEQLRIQKKEVTQSSKRCKELDNQNKVLHEQLQELSKKLISEQARPQDIPDAGVLPSEKDKSADQLLEVIKFIRREKDIAESRFELAQAENVRLQQKCELIEKQLEEAKQNLSGERERAQVLEQTSAQHSDLMKKVETLNVLSDSNRLQREEKERLQQQVHQLEAKVHKLESDILPLQEQNRDISAQRDALTAEKASLAYDVNRWKQRTDHLMQQYNRADPEEQKKLLAEKESNKKIIGNLNEENLRHKAELSRYNAQLSNARTEISKLNNSLTSAQSQMKMEQNKLREELNTVKAEVVAKDKDIEDKGKTINQVKKIGRRYKSQFEETKTKLDELEKKMATDKAAPPQPDPAMVAKVTELEQKYQALTAENTKLKEAEATTKTQLAEKEEKQEQSNRVLKGAKQKITQLMGERDKHMRENDELKGQLQAMEAIGASKEADQKKESDTRIAELEKKLQESKSQQVSQKEQHQNQLHSHSEEIVQLHSKVQEQQSQIEDLQKQLLQQHLQPDRTDRPSTSREEPPPTANIKPIASPATAVSKPSPHSSGARMTASIRPIPVTPTTSTSVTMATTPTATVMPQTSNVPSDQDMAEQPQSDAPILAIATATPIQAVPPTQQTPPVAMAEPITESDLEQEGVTAVEELGQAEEQTTETETTATAASAPSVSESTPIAPVGSPTAVATKRPRDDTSDGDGSSAEREEKRQRVTPQPPPIIEQESLQQQFLPQQQTEPNLAMASQETVQFEQETQDIVGFESLETQPFGEQEYPGIDECQQQQEPDQTTTIEVKPEDNEGQSVEQSKEDVAKEQHEEDEQPEQGGHEEDEDDEEIVIVTSEDEDGGDEREDDDEEEGDSEEHEEGEEEYEEEGHHIYEDEGDSEEHEEGEEEYEEEGHHIYEGMDGEEGMDEEGDDEEDDEEEGDEDEEEMEDEDEEGGDDQTMEEEEDSDDVVVIVSDDEEQEDSSQMETQHTEREEQPQQPMQQQQPPQQQVRRVAPPQLRVDPPEQAHPPGGQDIMRQMQHMGSRTRERIPSIGRPLFSLSSAGVVPFEDLGDHDGQVPSTPTLFVPPRTDGFAEAINSPLVQRQFQFGLDADRTRGIAGLAQLSAQGDLGMDDTRINLLGDEEGGRSVPTTPLQTHAPVTMLSASPSAPSLPDHPHDTSSQSVPVTTVSDTTPSASETVLGTDEPDTLPAGEVPQTKPQTGAEQEDVEQDRSPMAKQTETTESAPEGGDSEVGIAQDIPGGSSAPSESNVTGEDTAGTSEGTTTESADSKQKAVKIQPIVWGDNKAGGEQQQPPQREPQRLVPPQQARGVPPANRGGGPPTRGAVRGGPHMAHGGGGPQRRGGPQGGQRGRGFIQRTYPRGRGGRGGNFARRGGQGPGY